MMQLGGTPATRHSELRNNVPCFRETWSAVPGVNAVFTLYIFSHSVLPVHPILGDPAVMLTCSRPATLSAPPPWSSLTIHLHLEVKVHWEPAVGPSNYPENLLALKEWLSCWLQEKTTSQVMSNVASAEMNDIRPTAQWLEDIALDEC
jgi:hypothetical protein